ncbi:MAG TPA: hypothetical protein PLX06_10525 [Fimbriimonadaceae bacterium]|mgnify:CR=1 FL=1|nr:hypothetical protein [Fimbriimonadaceae bacterium]
MDNGAFFLGALFAMFFGTLFLTLYVAALYLAGRAFAFAANINRPVAVGVVKIAAACWLISLWPLFTDWHPLARLGLATAFFVGNAIPLAVGFGSNLRIRQEDAQRRFSKNVDDWLGEWEGESEVAEWNEGDER